ncbi:MAG: porin family protein [Alphaproteobacteria bacterium]|nr:porin family protein [Alphaproteobacteria bacterium]
MLLKTLLLGAAATLAATTAAQAKGWYVSLEAGVGTVADTDVDYRLTNAGVTTFSYVPVGRFDTGWALIAAVGYSLQNWHVEIEAGWRSNDKDRFTAIPISTGGLDELTLMYNMTYDFALTQNLALSVGGGAGIDYAMLDIVNVDDSDLNLAYQGIVALNYKIAPNTELTLGYRYLTVLDPSFEERTGGTGVIMNFDDITKHTLTAGVRYTFDT